MLVPEINNRIITEESFMEWSIEQMFAIEAHFTSNKQLHVAPN